MVGPQTWAESQSDIRRREYESYKNSQIKDWQQSRAVAEADWQAYKAEVTKLWQDGQVAQRKIYVEYWDQYHSRLLVDFERGRVHLELMGPRDANEKQRLAVGFKKIEALVGDQVKGSKNLEAADPKAESFVGGDGERHEIRIYSFELVPNHIKIRAAKYTAQVNEWSTKYRLPSALILAVIWQESAFNPLARSYIPAFGLMQIVPKYAGTEVKAYLQDTSTVDDSFLYAESNNLKYGSTYLHLLSSKHFGGIEAFAIKAPLVIAAYNWGPSRLLKLVKAKKIRMDQRQHTVDDIVSHAPAETKAYLIQVISKWSRIDSEKWL